MSIASTGVGDLILKICTVPEHLRRAVSSTKKNNRPFFQGLMGEANLRFARGDKDTAVRMCMEVIRQDPTAPEPFQTLSTIYEETDEQERSLQFALIAAHLAPQDAEEWARLADMSLELGDLHQAAACYRKGELLAYLSSPCILDCYLFSIRVV